MEYLPKEYIFFVNSHSSTFSNKNFLKTRSHSVTNTGYLFLEYFLMHSRTVKPGVFLHTKNREYHSPKKFFFKGVPIPEQLLEQVKEQTYQSTVICLGLVK